MEKTARIFQYAFLPLLFVLSCKSDPEPEPQEPLETPNHATFSLISPQQNSSYNQGDTVYITATLYGEKTLHGYDVYLHPDGDTTPLFNVYNSTHNDTISVKEKWVNNVSSQTGVVVEIITTLSHDSNNDTAKRVVNIQCMP